MFFSARFNYTIHLTIRDKEWITSQIARMCIKGLSQEEISRELNISEGTVSAIMQDLLASDDTLIFQHEIAVVCKKAGIPIKQLASNFAFSNAIKKKAFDSNKIDSMLLALHSVYSADGTISPDTAANLFLQICNLALKNDIPLDELYCQIDQKYRELDKLIQQVNEIKRILVELQNKKQQVLEENKVTCQELECFVNFREDCEEVGLDFNDRKQILNVLYDIDEMDQDPNRIVDEMKKIRFLKLEHMRLLEEFDKKAEVLEGYRKKELEQRNRWGTYSSTVDLLNSLLVRGVDPYLISQTIDIIHKHNDYSSVDELAIDIDTYGGIKAAISKKNRELEVMLSGIQNLDFSAATN